MSILSESFKNKMIKLSGVDLISEEKMINIKLIKENKFLSEELMLEEGIKDLALGLMSLLTVLGASAETLKPQLLKTNLKNSKQIEQFKQELKNKLSPDQVNSKDFQDFSNKLTELQKQVGTSSRHEGVVTHYTEVRVNESNLSFDLTNPESKKALDEVIAKAKKVRGSFVVSIDTLKEMVSKVAPTEETKLDEKIKISNQSFKGYNDYRADESIVDSIAKSITSQFQGYKNITGYILVKGGASNVPTTAFGGSNEKLAQARACSLTQQLEDRLPENLKNKIVVEYSVDGPQYEHDAQDTTKYQPYQFSNVDIHLAAIRSLPIINTPEKITVNVKILNTSIGAEQNVTGTIIKTGKKAGNSSIACPVNFRK